jgi:hypothetical protein
MKMVRIVICVVKRMGRMMIGMMMNEDDVTK